MSKVRDDATLFTEISPPETEVEPYPSVAPAGQFSGDRSAQDPSHGSRPHAIDKRLVIGQRLSGRYRIERQLGEGGMGVVYLATDEQVQGETFAIKVLKSVPDPEALEQLREEVRKTRKLSHPNIVDVHSVNVDGEHYYVLMEHLEGKSLDALLDEEFGRGIPFSHAWPIIEDVSAALSYAHDRNVIHSDLKPANIFVTTSGRTKLLDFGIARVSRRPPMHPSGSLVLTPGYASCEMLEGKAADRRDDVYSFACVIYEMLCGERPFGDLTAREAREAGTRVPPIAALSREQNAALSQALAFERQGRTASVEQLLERLAAKGPPRRPSVAFIGAMGIAFVGVAGLTYLILQHSGGAGRSVRVEGSPATAAQDVRVSGAPGSAAFNPPSDSIAVLPFINMSGDKEQEYFSDGLSEELIDRLVHSADLKVIARSSSFQFKGRNEDVRTISRELGVMYVLEGSVRKAGEHLRITAELVRAMDGVHLWSESYDRNLVDIFTVQHEIATKVSRALHVALRNGPNSAKPKPDVRAYNLVLEGNFFKARRTRPDVEKAAQLYQQAISISPGYALAWARLASAYLSEAILSGSSSEPQNRRILDTVEHAIHLDPTLAWPYYTRGGFEMNITWDWAAARADTERLRAVDPQFNLLQNAIGDIALVFGDADRAVELYQGEIVRNPLDPGALNALGTALCFADRLQECLQARLRLLQLHPEFGGVNRSVGLARLYLGQLDAALQAMQQEPNEDYRQVGLSLVNWALQRPAESSAALNALTKGFAALDPYGIAAVHAYRGEIDDAFQWLNRAYDQHNRGLLEVKGDPLLRNLHSDPRFQALLSRMGLSAKSQSQGPNVHN